eukprot:8865144-Pyramimonas_sp.AAC.1
MSSMTAGGALEVLVAPRDAFGNLCDGLDPRSVSVAATLADGRVVQLKQQGKGWKAEESGEKGEGSEEESGEQSGEMAEKVRAYSANLEQSGIYLVRVLVEERAVCGWPRTVHVTPGAVAPAKTVVAGAARTRPLVCGKASSLVIHTTDAFGNACAKGGADVAVALTGPGGEDSNTLLVEPAVSDCKDGSYTADVTVERAGEWTLAVAVNGAPARGFALAAVYGPPSARECEVVWMPEGGVCGATGLVRVRAGGDARTLDGTEGLGLSLVAPSGASRKVDLELKEEGAYAEWSVEWVEAGRHTLNVTLAGEHVKGSPATVEAEAQTLCLANSAMAGAGLHGCTAGERA